MSPCDVLHVAIKILIYDINLRAGDGAGRVISRRILVGPREPGRCSGRPDSSRVLPSPP